MSGAWKGREGIIRHYLSVGGEIWGMILWPKLASERMYTTQKKTHRQCVQDPHLGIKDTSMDARRRVRAKNTDVLILCRCFRTSTTTPRCYTIVVGIGLLSPKLNGPNFEQIGALFDHVEFHQTTVPFFGIVNGVQFVPMESVPGNDEKQTTEKQQRDDR